MELESTTDSAARLGAALGDRYAIERELGAGGMATVYLARDVKHDRPVAIKVLRRELAAVLGRERFLNEIRLTARLDHPHILTLIDSGEVDGVLYYVLPFVKGESLRDTLTREKQLGLEDALKITTQVASALEHAHALGIIHRDLKPENVLLRDGEAMLADFGIALAVRDAGGNRLTESGLSLGTPQYMSPEQATGDRGLDARSDLYSLAAMLYEMLAGEPPISGATAQAVIAKLMTERPTRLRAIRDTVPEGVDAAVAKALAKVPADRQSGVTSFVRELEAIGPVRRIDAPWRPLRWSAAMLVLVAGAAALWSVRRAPRVPPRRSYERVQLTTSGRARMPILSPDGSQIAYMTEHCEENGACRRNLVLRETATDAERVLLESATGATPMHWSADGLRLILDTWGSGRPNGAYAMSRLGGQLVFLGGGRADFVRGGDTALAAAGLSVRGSSAYLRRFALPLGQPLDSVPFAAPAHARVLNWIAVAPSGKWVAVGWERTGVATIALHSRSGVISDTLEPPSTVATIRWAPDEKALLLPFTSPSGVGALLRVGVDAESGTFGVRDTIFIGAGAGKLGSFDVSTDGRALVYDSRSEGEYAMWTFARRSGASAARPLRKVSTSSADIAGQISADGEQILTWTESEHGGKDWTQFFLTPFDSGGARPFTPQIADLIDFDAGPRRLFVATRIPGGRARLTSYDLATGRSHELGDLTSDDIRVWAGPANGVAIWNRPPTSFRLLDSTGRELRQIAIPDSINHGLSPRASPDGSEFALYQGLPSTWDSAEADGTMEVPIYAISTTTGKLRMITRERDVYSNYSGWTDDGWIHVVATTATLPDLRLYRVRSTGGTFEYETTWPPGYNGNCNMSANGLRWTCVMNHPLSDLYLIKNFDSSTR